MASGACVAGDRATAVDGTHPTGMYSCLQIYPTRSQVPKTIVSESFIRGTKVQLSRKTFNMYVYYILSRHQPTTIPTSTTKRTILFL